MSHFIKTTFTKLSQRCKDIRNDNLIKLDSTNFSMTVSLLQTWVLCLPIGQEIGTGVPPGKSLIVTRPIWRSRPTVHMKKYTPSSSTGPEKWPPPPIIIMGGANTMQVLWLTIFSVFFFDSSFASGNIVTATSDHHAQFLVIANQANTDFEKQNHLILRFQNCNQK